MPPAWQLPYTQLNPTIEKLGRLDMIPSNPEDQTEEKCAQNEQPVSEHF